MAFTRHSLDGTAAQTTAGSIVFDLIEGMEFGGVPPYYLTSSPAPLLGLTSYSRQNTENPSWYSTARHIWDTSIDILMTRKPSKTVSLLGVVGGAAGIVDGYGAPGYASTLAISILNNGALALVDQSVNDQTPLRTYAAAGTFAADTWHRLQLRTDATGNYTLRWFIGANVLGSTPDGSATGFFGSTLNNSTDHWWIGSGNNFLGVNNDGGLSDLRAGLFSDGFFVRSGGSTQTISGAGGIAGATALGTPKINQQVRPSGIAPATALGIATVNQQVRPSGISSPAALGTPTVLGQLLVQPSGIAPAGGVGSPTVMPVQIVSPDGIPSTVAFGSPTVQSGTIFILPTGIPGASAVGSPKLNLTVSPSSIDPTGGVGTPAVLPSQIIFPEGIAADTEVGTPSLLYTLFIQPSGIFVPVLVGEPTLIDSSATRELLIQRRITEVFIRTSPTTLVLTPQVRTTTSGGGRAWSTLPDRAPQTMRIIEPSDSGARDPVRTSDGIERQVDYILLGSYNAEVGLYDRFQYKGDDCEVVALMHDNGYETRAYVVRRGPMST